MSQLPDDDVCDLWPASAAPATTCDAQGCSRPADDQSCEEASRCLQVECPACLYDDEPCEEEGVCTPRTCVLCARSSDAVVELASLCSDGSAAPTPSGASAAWTLYEREGFTYRLLLSKAVEPSVVQPSVVQPSVVQPSVVQRSVVERSVVERSVVESRVVENAREDVRHRVGGMGMLALLVGHGKSSEGAIASAFDTGSPVAEVLRSFDAPSDAPPSLVRSFGGPLQGGAVDVGDVPPLGARALVNVEKRVSTITARFAADDIVDVDGVLDARSSEHTLRQRSQAFKLCYERALKGDRALEGKLAVEVLIGASGRVTEAHIVDDAAGSEELSACVLDAVERVRFPANPEDASLTARFVFLRER